MHTNKIEADKKIHASFAFGATIFWHHIENWDRNSRIYHLFRSMAKLSMKSIDWNEDKWKMTIILRSGALAQNEDNQTKKTPSFVRAIVLWNKFRNLLLMKWATRNEIAQSFNYESFRSKITINFKRRHSKKKTISSNNKKNKAWQLIKC